ncbi:MAG: NOP5/NOP56 family protein [Candidatus Natronoplasma sp.]
MSVKELILHTTWFGTFLVEEGKVVNKELFPKDPKVIAERKGFRQKGEVLEEEKELIEKVDTELIVTDERLSRFGEVNLDIEIEIDPEDYDFKEELLHESLQVLGKDKIRESIDFGEHLARAVKTIQDLNETINIKIERLKNWYSLYFPELENEVKDEEYLDLIIEYGDRDRIKDEIGLNKDLTGKEVTGQEIEHFKRLADSIREEKSLKDGLEGYIEEKMREIAPNITALTGPKLGGELIAAQGSLKELAKQPASTIQVLGAEKSLFRHLDKGTDPPKHGLILQHPYVHRAPEDVRGKIARAFANKIAIASRIDYFGGDYRGDKMREELEEKIERIEDQS